MWRTRLPDTHKQGGIGLSHLRADVARQPPTHSRQTHRLRHKADIMKSSKHISISAASKTSSVSGLRWPIFMPVAHKECPAHLRPFTDVIYTIFYGSLGRSAFLRFRLGYKFNRFPDRRILNLKDPDKVDS